jgi:transposase
MLSRAEISAIYDQGPEAVIALVERLMAILEAQQEQMAQVNARVKEMEDRLALNSRNSSKPPASNAPAHRIKSSRTASGKKPGAQPGHPGTTLKASPAPDHVVQHSAVGCQSCGQNLSCEEGVPDHDRRQVVEVPQLTLAVTEHQRLVKTCPRCGTHTSGKFPAGVAPGVQYGPQLKALVVYLVEYHLLPWRRTCEVLGDLLGQPIAEGTLAAALTTCAQGLGQPEEQIKQALTRAPVAHFDETGMDVAGHREWVHVASTSVLTHYGAHAKRGGEATKAIGILPAFTGRAVHDAWAPYFAYACTHGLCNAHHLRELTFVHEQLGQGWAGEMKDLLVKIKHAVGQANERGGTTLLSAQRQRFARTYDHLLATGLQMPDNQSALPGGKRGRPKQTKAKNLLDRLVQHKEEALAFMSDFAVPFDNNQAERDLRMLKVQQKISGCFRSPGGAQAFCRIRGYISTIKKQGRNVLAALSSVFAGNPLSPLPEG